MTEETKILSMTSRLQGRRERLCRDEDRAFKAFLNAQAAVAKALKIYRELRTEREALERAMRKNP